MSIYLPVGCALEIVFFAVVSTPLCTSIHSYTKFPDTGLRPMKFLRVFCLLVPI